jgi:hypothetical protein
VFASAGSGYTFPYPSLPIDNNPLPFAQSLMFLDVRDCLTAGLCITTFSDILCELLCFTLQESYDSNEMQDSAYKVVMTAA